MSATLPPPPQSGSPLAQRSRVVALLGDRRRMIGVLAVSSVISGLAEAGMLVVLAQIAATIVNKQKHVPVSVAGISVHATIGELFVIALVLAFVRLLLQVGPLSVLPARIGADVQAKLREMLFHSFTRASWEVQSRDREGHLQEIMTSQVLQASQGAGQATTLLTASFTFMILMASALSVNARAAGVVLVAALVLFAAMRPLNRLGVRNARQLSRAQLNYAGGISETVRLAEETQVFGVGEAQRDRIDGLIGIARRLYFRTQVIMRLTPNLYQSLVYLLLVAGLGGLYVVNKHNVAALGGVILLLIRAGTNGQQIQSSYQGLRQSLPFIERLQDAAARYSDSAAPEGDRQIDGVRRIAFEHVSFSYRTGAPVLSDVSFEVDGGEAIGIIGPSGAGKSTLVQILLQLRLAESGAYLVNGVPAEQLAREDWHRKVAYVPQEPKLLHASVAENIRYLREGIDDAAVERAARHARIHDDIMAWPDGYDMIVGPRADAVSGGQQQRICLARALAAAPEMLVLDEPTSALDPQSESLIQDSLRALKRELTLFIIAHRMSTLDVCDRVMVIYDGQLAAFDKVEVLQRENQYYRKVTAMGMGERIAMGGETARGPAAASTETAEVNGRADLAAPVDGVGADLAAPVDGRMPDFFIAGHPKSGTTALYEMLKAHPQIFMCEEKEPWFFSEELRYRTPPRKPFGIPATLEDYLALFAAAKPEQRVGEASTTYLWSPSAAQAMAAVAPQARIIAILREPASFLRSLHLQFVEAHIETEPDFRRALSLEGARREGREISRHSYWPQMLTYSDHVAYVEQLRRFHSAFPPEQVLVLIYDDFRNDNEATVRRVLRFLEVDDAAAIEVTEANATVRARSQRLHSMVHAVSVGHGPFSRSVKAAIAAVTPRRMRRGVLHAVQQHVVYTEPLPQDEELMLELRRRFRPEVLALSEYLDRDLVRLWGYEGL